MKQRVAVIGRLLAVLVSAALLAPPLAVGQPDGAAAPPGPVLPLTQLGRPGPLQFYGVRATVPLNIAVPPGMEPLALNAVAQLPVNVRGGTVVVAQGDRQISRIDVPPEGGTVAIPLAGALVRDGLASLTLSTTLLPVDGYCPDPRSALQLADPSVAFGGAEQQPTTVADFLPSVLRQLTIYVDGESSRAVADAAIRLATAVAAAYTAQVPDIRVLALPPGQTGPTEAPAPFGRSVVIREGDQTGVSLIDAGGVPALLVMGSAQDLANQSRLLTSGVDRLAMSAKVVVGPLNNTSQPLGDETTLRRLGQSAITTTGMSPQVNIAVDQTRLGRSAHAVRLHLDGSYTPLPPTVGGQLVASVGGQVIDRWAVDAQGGIDRWVDVPDRLLTRYTDVALELNISGNTGGCYEFEPPTLTVDGNSVVQSRAADPPIPAGFQSLPQALMPRTVVGVGEGFDDLRRALAIMVGLQRLSASPLDTVVKPLADAIGDTAPAVLVSPGGWTDDRLVLPVSSGAAGELTVTQAGTPAETTTLTMDPAMAFGSLQAVRSGNRSVLVATSNDAPGQLDALLDWLAADPQRWADLSGSALIAAAGQEPVMYGTASAAGPDVIDGDTPPAPAGLPRWLWVGLAVAAVLSVLTVGVVLIRGRRGAGRSE